MPTVDGYSKDFSMAYSFILEHLGFDLPDEWARLEQQLDALIQSLSNKPMWIIHKVGWQIGKLSYNQRTKQLAERISKKTWEIKQERSKPHPKIITVIAVDKFAHKIGELQTLNGTTLDFFAVEDCDKIFVHGVQLAVAAGYPKQAGATSDNTDFSKSANAVAQFYGIRRSKSGKTRRFVNIEDVPAILNEFAFNQTIDKEQYATATALLHWWIENSNIISGIKQ